MKIAQGLYEGVELGGETVGLITYMRTDGATMAGEAIAESRTVIAELHGGKYVPERPRVYTSRVKNAQEAHEAIRPTSFARLPEKVSRYLDADQARLYELIWKRALASQMESAEQERTTVDVADADGKTRLRATGHRHSVRRLSQALPGRPRRRSRRRRRPPAENCARAMA